MFIQHSNKTPTPFSNTAQSSYSTLIQKVDTAQKYQEDTHTNRDPLCFQFKTKRKKR